ncbi:MAG: YkgJ family cysteine cluster protein [Pseudomonadota bacterium]
MGRGQRTLNPFLDSKTIPPSLAPRGFGEPRPDEAPAESSSGFFKLTLSLLEKYLIRNDWNIEDRFAPESGLVMSEAFRTGSNAVLTYHKPTYHYIGRDRQADLNRALLRLGELEQVAANVVTRKIMAETFVAPPGFSCQHRGRCCHQMRDAYQGLVSLEEVEYWQSLGLVNILNLVSMEERDGYVLYAAWKNPKTGRYLKRCPWLTLSDGRSFCRIHKHKPLKCRVYPLSRLHGEYTGCRGFE